MDEIEKTIAGRQDFNKHHYRVGFYQMGEKCECGCYYWSYYFSDTLKYIKKCDGCGKTSEIELGDIKVIGYDPYMFLIKAGIHFRRTQGFNKTNLLDFLI